MLCCVLALSLAVLTPESAAQPPGGPANLLYLKNDTRETVRFTVLRYVGNELVPTRPVPVKPGGEFAFNLLPIQGDRVLLAGSGDPMKPWKLYGQASFNGAQSPFPTVGYVLTKDENGDYKLVPMLQAEATKGGTAYTGEKGMEPKEKP